MVLQQMDLLLQVGFTGSICVSKQCGTAALESKTADSEGAASSRGVSGWVGGALTWSVYRVPERAASASGAHLPFIVQPKKKPALALPYCWTTQLPHGMCGPLSFVSKVRS